MQWQLVEIALMAMLDGVGVGMKPTALQCHS